MTPGHTYRGYFALRAPPWPDTLFGELGVVEPMEPHGDDGGVFQLGTTLYSRYRLVLGVNNCNFNDDRPGSTGPRKGVITVEMDFVNVIIAETVNTVWAVVRLIAEQPTYGD